MIIQKMIVYLQNNSGGYFKEVKHLFRDDLTVVPCATLMHSSLFGEKYTDIGVLKGTETPKEIYFDGVEKGVDCECCGDRWNEDGDKEVNVYIFETKDELKQSIKNKTIPLWSSYVLFEDLK